MMGGPRTFNLDGSETAGDGRAKFARKATCPVMKDAGVSSKTTFQDRMVTRSPAL